MATPSSTPSTARRQQSKAHRLRPGSRPTPRLTGLGGAYAENNEISPLVELPTPAALQALIAAGETPVGVVPHAIDPVAADRLWDVSERLTVR